MKEREAFKKEQEMIRICMDMCKRLDMIGHYADLGMDVMVDDNKRVWVLEINKLHDHKYPLYALDDTQMYYKVISTPV